MIKWLNEHYFKSLLEWHYLVVNVSKILYLTKNETKHHFFANIQHQSALESCSLEPICKWINENLTTTYLKFNTDIISYCWKPGKKFENKLFLWKLCKTSSYALKNNIFIHKEWQFKSNKMLPLKRTDLLATTAGKKWFGENFKEWRIPLWWLINVQV